MDAQTLFFNQKVKLSLSYFLRRQKPLDSRTGVEIKQTGTISQNTMLLLLSGPARNQAMSAEVVWLFFLTSSLLFHVPSSILLLTRYFEFRIQRTLGYDLVIDLIHHFQGDVLPNVLFSLELHFLWGSTSNTWNEN